MNYAQEYNLLKNSFDNWIKIQGYKLEPSVALNSKIDPTVFLVGSCTNVFKKFFLQDAISLHGHAIIQPAVNSKYFPNIYDPNIKRFSSAYTALGLLQKTENLHKIIADQYNFFIQVAELNPNKLSIKVNDSDHDLMNAINQYPNIIKLNGDACRNKFGIYNGVPLTGRNIRFTYNGNNIGVLSIYMYNGQILGVESSSTIQVILTEKYSFKNTMETSVLNDLAIANTNFELKYYDCISVMSELLYFNTRPNSSHMDGRILKKYIKSMLWAEHDRDNRIPSPCILMQYYLDIMHPGHNMNIKQILEEVFAKCR